MNDYDNTMEQKSHGGGNSGGGGPPFKKPRGDGVSNGGPSAVEQFLERSDEKIPPNHILLITVLNPKMSINVEVIYKVCTIVGKVKKIICFERMNVSQAMVEFDTLEAASKARISLHGCDIYNNCCTMKVEYSKMDKLTVRENNGMSWDFTDASEAGIEGKRPVILNSPDFGGGYSSGYGNSGNMGMGGGNGMQNMPNKMPGMGMGEMGMGMAMNYGGYGMGDMDDRSCVMLVYGLEPPKWNCDRLFNLICQYGNVNKIFFMKNKPNTAMVEMGTAEGVDNVTRNLHDIEAFGERLRFDISKNHMRITNPPLEFTMSDGSSSVKEYFSERNLNRFVTPDMARKNRIIHPSKVLHFFNLTKVAEDELQQMFVKQGAVVPNQIKWVPAKSDAKLQGVGLCYFDNATDATEAMILVNHCVIEKRNIKLCYSPAKY